MTTLTSLQPVNQKVAAEQARGDAKTLPMLSLPRADWGRALFFLLVMSLTGLRFPLGYLLLPIVLISSFRNDKHHFIIQFTMVCGAYAFLPEDAFPFKGFDLALVLGVIGLLIYRKPPLIKRIVTAMIVYTAALFILATFSDESMAVQFLVIRPWLALVYFTVPLMVFGNGERFSMTRFIRLCGAYALIICCFYNIDGFILCGHIFVPASYFTVGEGHLIPSTWDNLYLSGFGHFPRKYPPGLYLLALIIIPSIRYYRLHWWQWLMILGALLASKTFTAIFAIGVGYMIFQPQRDKVMRWAIALSFMLAVAYGVDSVMPVDRNENTFLRVKSSIDQIINLGEAKDDEDLSQAGTGRIGQALPKLELMNHLDKQLTGLGFLHPTLTTNLKYIITNEYYSDISRNEEVATGIEIIPVQVYLNIGWIGLFIHFAFFIYLAIAIRRLKYALYFISVEVVMFIFGFGGFAGWTQPHGLLLMALALSAVLMANRRKVWHEKTNSADDPDAEPCDDTNHSADTNVTISKESAHSTPVAMLQPSALSNSNHENTPIANPNTLPPDDTLATN